MAATCKAHVFADATCRRWDGCRENMKCVQPPGYGRASSFSAVLLCPLLSLPIFQDKVLFSPCCLPLSLAISFPAIALNIRPIPSCPPFSAAPYRDIARHTLFGEEEGEADENPGEGPALQRFCCFMLLALGQRRSVGRSHRHHHRITIEAAAATEIKWAEKLQSSASPPPPPQTVRAR